MRLTAILRAGGRVPRAPKNVKPIIDRPLGRPRKVKAECAVMGVPESFLAASSLGIDDPEAEEEEDESDAGFSGRVHSESYTADNLSAAFETIFKNKSTTSCKTVQPSPSEVDNRTPTQIALLETVNKATLPVMESYRTSILDSLALEDPHGRIYSKNVRQMKEILGFEKWRKKLEAGSPREGKRQLLERHPAYTGEPLPPGSLTVRRALYKRPTVADEALAASLVKDFWKLDQLVDATVVLAFSGHPALIDEILKLKNIRKVIAIEEVPDYCLMYHERWAEEIKAKRLFHLQNDGYWWESYSDIEEQGLLDDVDIKPWDVFHPSLFYITQLPHHKRSMQFLVQLIRFIPNRNWLFQYGRFGLGILSEGDLCDRMTKKIGDKTYVRSNAMTDCFTKITSSTQLPSMALHSRQFFPFNLLASTPEKSSGTPGHCEAMLIEPLVDVNLTPDELECLTFLQRNMFVLSATSWVESISHAAAGAAIMYDKLIAKNQAIPRKTIPRLMTGEQWINLARCFNEWPFKPQTFENELIIDIDVDHHKV